jgi:2-keto-3-deoxy-L-rhamnonate aldolase RhmA
VTPLVRVPGHLGQDISRALDGGAQGVILPHVNTAEQAREIVSYAKYPPLGHRSVMGAGPHTAYKAMPLAKVNESGNLDNMVVIMLETPEGIANAEAIAAVPGVDMLLIGSNDLCTEMGIPGQLRHPSLLEAYQTVAKACKKHGIALGVGGIRGDAELQTQLIELGARFLIAGSDTTYLAAAATKDASSLRELIAGIKK